MGVNSERGGSGEAANFSAPKQVDVVMGGEVMFQRLRRQPSIQHRGRDGGGRDISVPAERVPRRYEEGDLNALTNELPGLLVPGSTLTFTDICRRFRVAPQTARKYIDEELRRRVQTTRTEMQAEGSDPGEQGALQALLALVPQRADSGRRLHNAFGQGVRRLLKQHERASREPEPVTVTATDSYQDDLYFVLRKGNGTAERDRLIDSLPALLDPERQVTASQVADDHDVSLPTVRADVDAYIDWLVRRKQIAEDLNPQEALSRVKAEVLGGQKTNELLRKGIVRAQKREQQAARGGQPAASPAKVAYDLWDKEGLDIAAIADIMVINEATVNSYISTERARIARERGKGSATAQRNIGKVKKILTTSEVALTVGELAQKVGLGKFATRRYLDEAVREMVADLQSGSAEDEAAAVAQLRERFGTLPFEPVRPRGGHLPSPAVLLALNTLYGTPSESSVDPEKKHGPGAASREEVLSSPHEGAEKVTMLVEEGDIFIGGGTTTDLRDGIVYGETNVVRNETDEKSVDREDRKEPEY